MVKPPPLTPDDAMPEDAFQERIDRSVIRIMLMTRQARRNLFELELIAFVLGITAIVVLITDVGNALPWKEFPVLTSLSVLINVIVTIDFVFFRRNWIEQKLFALGDDPEGRRSQDSK